MKRLLHPRSWLSPFALLCALIVCFGNASGQSISAVEYYFDVNPGFGNGYSIPVAPADTITMSTVLQNLLSDGFHYLYVHARDTSGVWGIPTPRGLWHQRIATNGVSRIAAAEYYFDYDTLRFGAGLSIPVSLTDSQTVSVTAMIPPTISQGFHTFNVRLRDELGQVGLPAKKLLWVEGAGQPTPAPINAAEYFFDFDPGIGFGIAAPVTNPGVSVTQEFVADLSTLTPGFHTMYFRVRDANNNWSTKLLHQFWVTTAPMNTPTITSAEYFVDTDPGFGSGRPVVVTGDTATVQFVAVLEGLTEGYHNFFLRSRDTNGNWSSPYGYRVYVTAPPTPGFLMIQYNVNQVDLSWTPASGTFDGYRIYRSATAYFSPSPETYLTTVGAQTTNYSDPVVGMEYYYRVTAYANDSDTRTVSSANKERAINNRE